MQIVDMHCDTISRLLQLKQQGKGEALYENTGHLDIKKMQAGGYLLQNFALFVQLKKCADPWQQVQTLYHCYQEELEKNKQWILPVTSFVDVEKNKEQGKISALLTVEEGGVCQGQLEKLEQLYHQGVRMLTLTWNYPNEIGYPNIDLSGKDIDITRADVTRGLTAKGEVFVERMEELGMIIDVSHLSDRGFYQVLERTKKPFVASHSNAREISPCARNMADDMIVKLAERGGAMGLNFCQDFLKLMPAKECTSEILQEALVQHAKHIAKVGGIECLGLGSDFDGIGTNEFLPNASAMEKLWDIFAGAGFLASEIEKILGGNVLRLYKDTL